MEEAACRVFSVVAAIPTAWSTCEAAIFPDSAISQTSPQSSSGLRVKAAAEGQKSAAVLREEKGPVILIRGKRGKRGVWDLGRKPSFYFIVSLLRETRPWLPWKCSNFAHGEIVSFY